MATTTKSLSATQMGVRYGITEKTARLFMLKIREAMKSSENNPMNGKVHVDEFVLGGYEQGKIGRSYNSNKKKVITAVELTDDGKVKRMYAMKINDFSARSLQYMFVNHIDRDANITTDKWKGYRPIAKAYNITQINSNGGLNFKALHTMIHQNEQPRGRAVEVSNRNSLFYFDTERRGIKPENRLNLELERLILGLVILISIDILMNFALESIVPKVKAQYSII